MIKHPESKIFVTGIYGSGKTTYAKKYAESFGLKYVDFDRHFSYKDTITTLKDSSDNIFLKLLGDNYITDAIPWNPQNGSLDVFKKYCDDNKVKIVCCVCPSKEVWATRLREVKKLEVNEERYKHYVYFYQKSLTKYPSHNVVYFDTILNDYITKEQMFDKISWINLIEPKIEKATIKGPGE